MMRDAPTKVLEPQCMIGFPLEKELTEDDLSLHTGRSIPTNISFAPFIASSLNPAPVSAIAFTALNVVSAISEYFSRPLMIVDARSNWIST